MTAEPEWSVLLCSFCTKTQKQVKKLIAGPGVYICDECVDLCNRIIDEELDPDADAMLRQLRRSTADADELVQRLKDAGVDWDRIAAALRGDDEDDADGGD